jgi:hypothetical protein
MLVTPPPVVTSDNPNYTEDITITRILLRVLYHLHQPNALQVFPEQLLQV